jgi:hypothetical protein
MFVSVRLRLGTNVASAPSVGRTKLSPSAHARLQAAGGSQDVRSGRVLGPAFATGRQWGRATACDLDEEFLKRQRAQWASEKAQRRTLVLPALCAGSFLTSPTPPFGR